MTEDVPLSEADPIGEPPWLEDLRSELEMMSERAKASDDQPRTLLDRLFERGQGT